MTIHPVTWIDGVQVSAAELRASLVGLLASGPAPLRVDGGVRRTDGSDLRVDRGTSGLTVKVQPGACLVPGTETTMQSGYGLINDAPYTVTLAAASSANPRTDLIVARIVDTGVAATSTFTLEPVTGNASAPGAPTPATPANCLILASIYVPVNATLSQLVITDKRTWLTVAAPPPPQNWTNLPLTGGVKDGGQGKSLHRIRPLPATGQVELQWDVDTGTAASQNIVTTVPSWARPSTDIRLPITTSAAGGVTFNGHFDVRTDGTVQLNVANIGSLPWFACCQTYTPAPAS